ncbi:4-oxalocrotonate tautomerase family protein [Cryobacterium frigoriphilum]|uniref:4-oxalocrotonate tautomerase family protein n=1 Tax=Cryobacterium frigoriphilum TaxID=1259150 RepID=A0A4R8ZV54_9MICO|nr:tautomerase family protein [Cryobacterium frigoriphilum]TFD46929.1 4-oxalocrotonate tautomerase family protein [Cryobacterium frigoriphilum]
MPLVEITLTEGRTEEQLRDLMRCVHTAIEEWGAPRSSIRVLVREIPPALWLSGGVTLAEQRGLT